MQDIPTAVQLLDAVAAFLEEELLPEAGARRAYHLRVAVNLLRIVGREWKLEPVHLDRAWREAATLLGRTGDPPADAEAARAEVRTMLAEVTAGIRAGRFRTDDASLRAALDRLARDKLEVAHPGYARDAGPGTP